mgnify:CR=1 FL=1
MTTHEIIQSLHPDHPMRFHTGEMHGELMKLYSALLALVPDKRVSDTVGEEAKKSLVDFIYTLGRQETEGVHTRHLSWISAQLTIVSFLNTLPTAP